MRSVVVWGRLSMEMAALGLRMRRRGRLGPSWAGASHAGCPVEEPDVEVQEQNADDSANNSNYITESRVGSRGPKLSKVNTP